MDSDTHISNAINLINSTISKYGLESISVSFNGGKDCTALLHLVHSKILALSKPDYKLLTFYAKLPEHFDEEAKFVDETIARYNLKLVQYSAATLKESLQQFKADYPSVEAIFIGTRKDDLKQGTELKSSALTDQGWPRFMRIHPILEWSYQQVWDFIRTHNVPYCDLYNQGYSSLGARTNTLKNTNLLRYTDQGEPIYLPAWRLAEQNLERSFRTNTSETKASNCNVNH